MGKMARAGVPVANARRSEGRMVTRGGSARTGDRAVPADEHGGGTVVPLRTDALRGLRTPVLDQLSEAVLVLDRRDDDWHAVLVNAVAARLTGLQRQDLLGPRSRVRDALGLDADGAAAVAAALAGHASGSLTLAARRADGRSYWAGIQLAPLRLEDVEQELWSAVVRDVSEEVANAQAQQGLLEAERRARVGLSLVARVSDLLQEADSADVLRAIADMLIRQAVAWCAFVIVGRNLRVAEGIDDDPPPIQPTAYRFERTASDPVLDLLLGAAMRTVRLDPEVPAVEGTLTADLLALVAPHLRRLRDARPEVLVLPVLGRQRTLGLLVALPRRDLDGVAMQSSGAADAAPSLHDEFGTVLELTARRVGMAMDNAQLYAREHALAETLQRAMLPEQDDVPGLDVWTYYAPNAEHAQVGGDWYDVVNLDQDRVAVVIGDVVGHDVEAAAAMGQLRSVVRAYAAELVDPGTVLGRVDALVAGMRIPRSASLVYATLTPAADGAWDMAYSRAGHLPPLLVREGTVTALDGAHGTLIGFGLAARGTATARLEPGDVLVLYTDGLLERRDRPMRAGLEALRDLCARVHAPDAAGVGEELLQLADAAEDDVALVVIRVPGGSEGEVDVAAPRRRRWQLPVDAASIGRARHAVRRACAAWGIEDVAAAELVISELTANAVMHGWGRIGLRLQDTGDGLRIEVEDANPAPPITRERSTGRVGGFGMHIVDRLADWGWRPTPSGKVVWARLRSQTGATSGGATPGGATPELSAAEAPGDDSPSPGDEAPAAGDPPTRG
ncbi:SpoIIE family protein phosphatase [Georgenia yuyongxinii]|uniref:SpoIIE family protein phosphatase n=2 Tax=Georgenia yuyongxinii TaxID=2589797 RepID=A0A552WUU6_9MICO|nr:SpoIIE family protein phosphatase [Georgenia yuyongxinii]